MNSHCICSHPADEHGDSVDPNGVHACYHRDEHGEFDCGCAGYERYPMAGAYAPQATCTHGIHPYDCEEGCDPHTNYREPPFPRASDPTPDKP
jgi:hypothetical protein